MCYHPDRWKASQALDTSRYHSSNHLTVQREPKAEPHYKSGLQYERVWLEGTRQRAQDLAEAAARYRRASAQGHVLAQLRLALMYMEGRGVPMDPGQAQEWLRQATHSAAAEHARVCRRLAIQGYTEAQYELGLMYAWGCGVATEDGAALKWYRLAAEQGHAESRHRLGQVYQYRAQWPELATVQDRPEAMKWYHWAAEQGHPEAQFELGRIHDPRHESGIQLELWQDEATACQWYQRSAEQGEPRAQLMLGLKYASPNDQEGPREIVQAYRWLSRPPTWFFLASSAQRAMKRLEAVMTEEQLVEARKRPPDLS